METGGGAGSSQQAAPDDEAAGTPAASSTPDPATAPGSPNAGGQGGTTTSVKPRRRKFKLVKWQTTIVGIAAAAATIIAAYITTHGGPPAPAPTSPATPGPTPVASISSQNFVHVPPPPTLRWTFYGGVIDPPTSGGYAVYVIIPNPSPAVVLAHKWLVSPPARVSADGSWQVRWTLSLPGRGSFQAMIIYGAPTSGIVTLPPGQVIVADLERYGPAAAKAGHFRTGIGNSVSRRAGSRA